MVDSLLPSSAAVRLHALLSGACVPLRLCSLLLFSSLSVAGVALLRCSIVVYGWTLFFLLPLPSLLLDSPQSKESSRASIDFPAVDIRNPLPRGARARACRLSASLLCGSRRPFSLPFPLPPSKLSAQQTRGHHLFVEAPASFA